MPTGNQTLNLSTDDRGRPPPAAAEAARPTFGLSVTHISGTALAAVTAAVGASVFGVGGTIVGALFGSVVSTVGGAVYASSLERAGKRLRTGVTAGTQRRRPAVIDIAAAEASTVAAPVADTTAIPLAARPAFLPPIRAVDPAPTAVAAAGPTSTSVWRRIRWKPVAVLAGVAFVLAVAFISASELFLGHTFGDPSAKGTSVEWLVGGGDATDSTPEPTETPESTPDATEPGPVPEVTTTDAEPSQAVPTPSVSSEPDVAATTAPVPTSAAPTAPVTP